jgi:hypothetical protein
MVNSISFLIVVLIGYDYSKKYGKKAEKEIEKYNNAKKDNKESESTKSDQE